MPSVDTDQVSLLLERAGKGDRGALDELIPLVYDELRRIAGQYIRRERSGQDLQVTALVNEAYIRLVGQRDVTWQNRARPCYGIVTTGISTKLALPGACQIR